MPAHKFVDGRFVTVVQSKIAVLVENFGTVTNGGASKAVAGAVPRHASRELGGLGDLACGLGPFIPGGLGTGDGYFGLVKQGFVDVGAGHGQL